MSEPSRAVFLSYASEDAEPARRICEALKSAGIEVWFDQSELRGGDAWDAAIRTQIKGCALFVPIISANAHARVEGYFRLEWKLAVDRSHLMAPDQAFLLPVVIDDTPQSDPRIPERFRELQWTHLPDGTGTAAFVEHVSRLLGDGRVAAPPVAPAAAPAPAAPARGRPAALGGKGLWAAVALIAAASAYLLADRLTSAHRPTADAPPAATARTIAVLPFADLSEKHDQEYFGDGLAEELIDLLAKTPGLQVIARTSSFSFKGKQATVGEIGRVLNVANVLEGSVRKSGKRLRITTQLVRTDTGGHLWSEIYDRDEEDVFAVQAEIAKAVAARLRLTLLGNAAAPAVRTPIPQAHELYLQGRYQVALETVDGTSTAVESFRQALAIDPNFAAAWAGLAFARFRQAANGYVPVKSAYDEAMIDAQNAVALDPDLEAGHSMVGAILWSRDLDWTGARAAVERAIALDPNSSQALFGSALLTMTLEGVDAALPKFRHVLEVDPLNLLYRRYFARFLYFTGRLEEAETMVRGVLQANPSFPAAHYELGRILLARGRVTEAIAEFEAEPKTSGWHRFGLPLGYYAAKRTADAEAALKEQLRDPAGSEYQVAETYAFMGDVDRAFYWLNRAVERRDPGIQWMRDDPLLKPVVNDPRYAALLARIGLRR